MPSGENSTADSLTKMRHVLAEQSLVNSQRMANANWERGQRAAWGPHYREGDGGGEEMILVDSTVTIHQAAPVTGSAADASSPASPATASKAGTLLKLAAGAALVASGAGAGVGLPLLLSGGADVAKAVGSSPPASQGTDAAPAPVPVAAPSSSNPSGGSWILELVKP